MPKIHITTNGTTAYCNRPGKVELTTALSEVTCDRCPHLPTVDLVLAWAAWGSPEARDTIDGLDSSQLVASSESNIARLRELVVAAQAQHDRLLEALALGSDAEAVDHSGEPLYASKESCIAARAHLTRCDNDGYCKLCGEQGETADD